MFFKGVSKGNFSKFKGSITVEFAVCHIYKGLHSSVSVLRFVCHGGQTYLTHIRGGGQSFLYQEGGQTFLHQGGDNYFYIEDSYAGFHASGKGCGQNGPKFIAPSIFGQISKVMSGFFPYTM